MAKAYFDDINEANELITVGMIKIGFSTVMVEKYAPPKKVIRCFKCSQLGHMMQSCKNSEKCGKCAQAHKTSECTSPKEDFKCVNCAQNHASYDKSCPLIHDVLNQINKKSTDSFL